MVTPDPAAAKQRMEADLDAAERWGERRRSGEIRDEGCDSITAWLLRNPTAAEAVERQRAVERRAE